MPSPTPTIGGRTSKPNSMRKPKKMQLCMASADADKAAPAAAAAKTLKQVGADIQTALASIIPDMEEPLRDKWNKALESMQAALANIPENDDSTAKAAASALATNQVIISDLHAANKALTEKLQVTLAGIPAQVEQGITAKVTAGDLVPKDKHTQAITDATNAATTAARATAMVDVKRISERTTLLTAASVPVPATEKLLGEDADFNARKTTAESRQKDLAPFKLATDRVLTLCWDADDASYKASYDLMKAAFDAAAKQAGAPANPFMNPSGDKKPAPYSATFGLC